MPNLFSKFGLEPHPSDNLIHWTEQISSSAKDEKDTVAGIKQLRADWDLVHSTPELAAAFERLQERVTRYESFEQAAIEAGENL